MILFARGHFTTSHLPGSEVSAPKFSLCLPVPFTRFPMVFQNLLNTFEDKIFTCPCHLFKVK